MQNRWWRLHWNGVTIYENKKEFPYLTLYANLKFCAHTMRTTHAYTIAFQVFIGKRIEILFPALWIEFIIPSSEKKFKNDEKVWRMPNYMRRWWHIDDDNDNTIASISHFRAFEQCDKTEKKNFLVEIFPNPQHKHRRQLFKGTMCTLFIPILVY